MSINDEYSFLLILLESKFNFSKFSNFIFSNTFISDILLQFKYNSFNSLKLAFSKLFISNISNLSHLTFSNVFISDI